MKFKCSNNGRKERKKKKKEKKKNIHLGIECSKASHNGIIIK